MIDHKIKLSQYPWLLAIIVFIALAIAACGRKGMPDRPIDSEYPHSYPSK